MRDKATDGQRAHQARPSVGAGQRRKADFVKSGLIQLKIGPGEDCCLVVDRTVGREEGRGEHGEGFRLEGGKKYVTSMPSVNKNVTITFHVLE